MANWWTSGGDWKPVLAKFQKVLKLAKRPKFDEAKDQLYLDAQLLIELRNNLVHFKFDWYEVGIDSEFDAKLAARIKPSPLVAPTDAVPWFPVKALGSPGAEWAVATARAFADEWVTRMDSWRTYEVDFAHWQALGEG